MITQQELVDYLKEAGATDVRDLVSVLEDELGVTIPNCNEVIVPNIEVIEDEQTEFDVILTGFTGSKVDVIKEVRKITGLGLREAKDVVDNAPSTIAECVSKERAEEIKQMLEETSAIVELK